MNQTDNFTMKIIYKKEQKPYTKHKIINKEGPSHKTTIKDDIKTAFILKSIKDGWNVRPVDDGFYILTKNHENKREIFLDGYLENFLQDKFSFLF